MIVSISLRIQSLISFDSRPLSWPNRHQMSSPHVLGPFLADPRRGYDTGSCVHSVCLSCVACSWCVVNMSFLESQWAKRLVFSHWYCNTSCCPNERIRNCHACCIGQLLLRWSLYPFLALRDFVWFLLENSNFRFLNIFISSVPLSGGVKRSYPCNQFLLTSLSVHLL